MNTNNQKAKSIIGSRYAYGVLFLLILIYITSFIDRQIIAVLANRIKEALELSNFEVGLLYGPAFSLVYAFFGLPMGRLADLYNRKWIIISGLVCWSAATFASGWAGSLMFLIVTRIIVGISESTLSPAVYSLLTDYFKPEQRATVFSLYASGIFIGIGLAFLVGGTIAGNYNWRTALFAVGLPGFLIAIIAIFLIRELPRGVSTPATVEDTPDPSQEESTGEVFRYLLSRPTIRWHLVGFSFMSVIGYTVLGFISTILSGQHGAPHLVPHYGWFMLLTGISVTISGRLADWLARIKNPSWRFVMGIVAALGGLPLYIIALLFIDDATTVLLMMGTAVVCSSSYNGIAPALLQYLVKPNMRALAGGLYLFIISVIGLGIGPPLAGFLMDTVFTGPSGPSHALLLVILVSALASTFSFLRAMQTYTHDALD